MDVPDVGRETLGDQVIGLGGGLQSPDLVGRKDLLEAVGEP